MEIFPPWSHPSAGRGGSVSRRDHNQAARTRAQLTGATCMEEESTQTPATLRVGARGRGFSKSALRMELTRHVLTHRQVAAALSAAVNTTKPIETRTQLAWARTFEGKVKPIPSQSSGGSAREELLLE